MLRQRVNRSGGFLRVACSLAGLNGILKAPDSGGFFAFLRFDLDRSNFVFSLLYSKNADIGRDRFSHRNFIKVMPGLFEMNKKTHWEGVYASKPAGALGWYKPHLQTSIAWIKELGLEAEAPIIDVGGGVSTLVDDLLNAGHRSISVLDISEEALKAARARLGAMGEAITWLNGDITSFDLPRHHYELWHDRAAFHFLTELDQQQSYRDNLLNALKPGGHLIIGTFAPEAPPKCSGLPIQRYTHEKLNNVLGGEFELQRHDKELHVTPGGVEQMYLYCHFRKKG